MPESEQYVSVCEACRDAVTPATPGVVRAFEQVDVTCFGSAYREFVDAGVAVLFHEDCFPYGSQAYRLA